MRRHVRRWASSTCRLAGGGKHAIYWRYLAAKHSPAIQYQPGVGQQPAVVFGDAEMQVGFAAASLE